MPRYSDYDDDDDERRPPKSSGGGKTLLIVFGIIGGIVLVVGGVCAGLVYLIYRGVQGVQGVVASAKSTFDDMQASQMAADNFMNDVAANRLDKAYNNTTKNFQTQQTLAQFTNSVQKSPGLKNYQPFSLQLMNFTSTASTYQGQMPGQNKAFTLQVVKDGQTWKVDQFTIP
jgi:hypothetical protein